eukprot:gene5864-8088_t
MSQMSQKTLLVIFIAIDNTFESNNIFPTINNIATIDYWILQLKIDQEWIYTKLDLTLKSNSENEVVQFVLLTNTTFKRNAQEYFLTRNIPAENIWIIDDLNSDFNINHIVDNGSAFIDVYFIPSNSIFTNSIENIYNYNIDKKAPYILKNIINLSVNNNYFEILPNSKSNQSNISFCAIRSDFNAIYALINQVKKISALSIDEFYSILKLKLQAMDLNNNQSLLSENYYLLDNVESSDNLSNLFSIKAPNLLIDFPTKLSVKSNARIGLMGNPSDGFQGKTLSFLIDNFYAEVTIEYNNTSSLVEIIPHPIYDPLSFSSLDSLQLYSTINGYTGGIRLIQATCKVFSQLCQRSAILIHKMRGFRISYDTNIPRMVGLSGSSAIVVATFRSLLRYHKITLKQLGILYTDFPQIILDIEKEELGIAAGLQDRVIQVYGGLVHMDFSDPKHNRYTPYEPSLLPRMYLAYNIHVGGDSGKVHSTVRERWNRKDEDLVLGMRELGVYADQAINCLQQHDTIGLAILMEKNFAMRRKLYGDNVVGEKNIAMVQLANKFGFSAKFTGSGGALLCIRKDGLGWLDADEEEGISKEFKKNGFSFVRIAINELNSIELIED